MFYSRLTPHLIAAVVLLRASLSMCVNIGYMLQTCSAEDLSYATPPPVYIPHFHLLSSEPLRLCLSSLDVALVSSGRNEFSLGMLKHTCGHAVTMARYAEADGFTLLYCMLNLLL